MQPTPEQAAIICATGDLKINAVAGSGKTTTLIEYARHLPSRARVLYIAFNRTVRQEATRKFEQAGLANVQVETAHSLAYRYVVRGSRYKVRATSYRAFELVALLGLPKGSGEHDRHLEYILASHIIKLITYFCNSTATRVQELEYQVTLTDQKARDFVAKHYATIEKYSRRLLAMMDRGEIEILHDFYLKKFQLSATILPADYILFDEGQDASGAMLDIFFRQPATKIIVGDAHQQIYSWRHAINALEKADYPSLALSTSFRFGPAVAQLATSVLRWKVQLGVPHELEILGAGGGVGEGTTKAIISRTNLGLLLKAIEYVKHHRDQLKRVYFEGNINSYTYADEGASLYDVLALYNGRSASIRDPLIKQMSNLSELAEYADQVEDGQLKMLIQIVEDYGNEVVDLIKELKRLHVADGARSQAQLFFSTVHRCKGMEYDQVQLAPDFITQAGIDKLEEEFTHQEPEPAERARVMEEINLLYVALTRARYRLYLPAECLPTGVVAKAPIHTYFGTGGTMLLPPKATPKQTTVAQWDDGPAMPAAFASLQQRLDAAG